MTRTFGPAYDVDLDGKRISDQHTRIRRFMLRANELGQWMSLAEISLNLGYPEGSISAQLRHLRKKRFGEYRVEKRRRVAVKGTWEYRVQPPIEILQLEMM